MSQTLSRKDLIIFELIWAGIFLVIGIYPALSSDSAWSMDLFINQSRYWSLALSGGFAGIAILFPALLTGFYHIWVKFGEFIGNIISKIILIIMFYCLFTPISLCLRLLGKDLLHKKLNFSAKSYWIDREIQPGTLKNQF